MFFSARHCVSLVYAVSSRVLNCGAALKVAQVILSNRFNLDRKLLPHRSSSMNSTEPPMENLCATPIQSPEGA
ncbi:hypothetical protein Ae201684_009198 [Aphanomyces euteiches]|uniref:Uncharacterized protein n=1 Tax=Aphanomyces euteiches TaxID=100861 RepID=A0A6G0X2K0_9STRA|nr:hypothetical protein Ae201684_009198 [Aphanomyces euteiches]